MTDHDRILAAAKIALKTADANTFTRASWSAFVKALEDGSRAEAFRELVEEWQKPEAREPELPTPSDWGVLANYESQLPVDSDALAQARKRVGTLARRMASGELVAVPKVGIETSEYICIVRDEHSRLKAAERQRDEYREVLRAIANECGIEPPCKLPEHNLARAALSASREGANG